MWDPSERLAPLKNDSIAHHFVKILYGIGILEEQLNMDRIRLLFHKVLPDQYFVRIVKEIEKPSLKKRSGVRNTIYATDALLERLYVDDWDRIDDIEKLRRRCCLHKRTALGSS